MKACPAKATSSRADGLMLAAHEWLRQVRIDGGSTYSFRVEAPPAPAKRAVSRTGHVYWTKPYATYLSACVKQVAEKWREASPIAGPVGVIVETIISRPKTTVRTWPRGDTDNLVKAPLDACKKAGVWLDDDQVLPLAATKRFAEPGEEPGVILTVGELPA